MKKHILTIGIIAVIVITVFFCWLHNTDRDNSFI